MPIHRRENQYRGINAHLHSHFQQRGDWEGFHSLHISLLTVKLDTLLPPNYYAINENSLQISGYDLTGDKDVRIRTRADISLYRSEPSTSAFSTRSSTFSPVATIPVAETIILDDDFEFQSVVVYQITEGGSAIPVTRIELLSPGNKPPQSHYRQYVARRAKTLESGIRLVELDYLHQSRSPIDILPSYPHREVNAFPYTILVSNPHPSLQEGLTAIYGINVDDPLPVIDVPLAGDELVTVDFGTVYHETFAANRYYGLIVVDYEQVPIGFDTYSAADQERITQRMAAIASA